MYNREKEPEPEFRPEEPKKEGPVSPLFSDEVFEDLELGGDDLDKLPV